MASHQQLPAAPAHVKVPLHAGHSFCAGPPSIGSRFGKPAVMFDHFSRETRLGSNVTLNDLHDLIFGHRSDKLVGYLAALENKKRRNSANVELPRCVAVLIHV
jgi:hypothetical protein